MKNIRDCMELCVECSDKCEETLFQHCLKMGGPHIAPEHVKLMTDCIEICRIAASFMNRGSAYHNYVCEACAVICKACADSCNEIGGKEMEACAEICNSCAKSCEQMGKMKAAA